MSIVNTNTFLVTISPKGDVSTSCEEAIVKYVQKNAMSAYVVAERGANGQRHLHAALCFEVGRQKQRLQEDLWKFKVKKWHGDSVGKIAVVVTNMYNHDWYNSYLRKEDGVEVLHDNYDEDLITPLFPTQEQQEYFQATKGKRIVDSDMHTHEVLWSEMFPGEKPTVQGALKYLRTRMFIERDMMVIRDERRLQQLALALYRYRAQDIRPSGDDESFMIKYDPQYSTFKGF